MLDCALRPKNSANGEDLDRQYSVKVGDVSLNKDMLKDDVQRLKGTGKVTIPRVR